MRARADAHPLTERLWDEWGAVPTEDELAAPECSGLLSGLFDDSPASSGTFSLRTGRLRAARRLLRLWRQTLWAGRWDLADALSIEKERGRERVSLRLPEGLWGEVSSLGAELAGTDAGRWAWLRGLWGSCGNLYFPRSGHYLVMRVTSGSVAAVARPILERTGIPWRTRSFHGAHESILRGQEDIVTFLCNIGLSEVPLQLEQRAMVRSMRDQANRASNCDAANIRRSLRVAEEQSRLAERLAREGLLPLLPPALRELAEARLADPGASLSELGEKLSPPIRKSTVKYRWARLSDHAEKIK